MKAEMEIGLNLDDITRLISRKNKVSEKMVFTFSDFTKILSDIFKISGKENSQLLFAGPILPEVEIAVDRADLSGTEIIENSPFSYSKNNLLEQIKSKSDIICLSNPNRITGSNLSLSDLKELAAAVTEGALIIDEYYYDHFGISGVSILDDYNNVIILRSFSGAFGIRSSDAGFLLSSQRQIERIKDFVVNNSISLPSRKSIYQSQINDDALTFWLQEVHDESLRLAKALNKIGVQCRLTATDYLLLRVSDPARVGNFLAKKKVPLENLDGYPKMKNYVRYQIVSFLTNNFMLEAFEEMPEKYYKISAPDRRAVTIRRRSENSTNNNRLRSDKSVVGSLKERQKITGS